MKLPKTFVNPNYFHFLYRTYDNGISKFDYCGYLCKDKRYILEIDDMCCDESNILFGNIDRNFIINALEKYEKELYKKQLMKELGINFKYLRN